MIDPQEKLLATKEVAAFLRIHFRTLAKWCRRFNVGPSWKARGAMRWTQDDLSNLQLAVNSRPTRRKARR